MAKSSEAKKPPCDQDKLDAAIGDWHLSKDKAEEAVMDEAEKRQAVIVLLYPDGLGREKQGIQNWAMPGNWVLKIDVRVNVSINKEAIPIAEAELAKLGVNPETGEVPTLDAAIKYEPKFSKTGWDGLTDAAKKICSEAMLFTFKHGTPGVELSAPKQSVGKASAVAGFDPFNK